MPADDPITAAVFDFVDQFLADRERGEAHDVEHYVARFPGNEHAVRREHAALLRATAAPTAEPGLRDRRIGPYEVVEEIGRGGQATVYRARDTRLPRDVALKVLPPAAFVSAARLQRFRREADVVASLSHPGICDVLEADFDGEIAYIAMRFVAGRPLHEAWREVAADRVGVRRAMALIEHAARALHVAHEAGVVHRDVKPANVMVTPEGEPVILDFGLAREVGDASMTEPGAVFGTLDYMAPEQLADAPTPVDRRTDVHALAATLYELVTSVRPFAAPTREAVARRIRTDLPKDPRALNPHVPADLAVVLAKALEKDPARRYPTALAFAEDLRRVVAYEPIHARPASAWTRVGRWARRHPVLAASSALAASLLTAGLAVTLVLLRSVMHERERYRAIFYATHARKLVEQDAGFALLTALESARIQPSFLAHTALYEVLAVCREERRLLPASRQDTVAVAPSGGWVVAISASGDGDIESLAPEPAPAVRLPLRVRSAGFDPRGEHLIAGGEDGTVMVFARDGSQVAALPSLGAPVVHVALGPGARLATASTAKGTTRVFDLASARPVVDLRPLGALAGLGVTTDGRRVWTLADGSFAVHEPTGGAPMRVDAGGPVHACALAAAGTLVALATPAEVATVDLATGTVTHRFATRRPVSALAFDPTGERLAACERGRFSVWSLGDGATLLDESVHRNQILWDIAWSQDGEWLATAGLDNSTKVFQSRDGALRHDFPLLAAHPRKLRFTRDGSGLVVAASNAHVIAYRLDRRPGQLVLDAGSSVHAVRLSPDDAHIAAAAEDGRVRVWDRGGAMLHELGPLDEAARDVRWSGDGRKVIAVTVAGRACVFDLASERATPLAAAATLAGAWLDARGRAMAVTTTGEALVFSAAGADGADSGAARKVTAAAFDPTRGRVAIGYDTPRVDVVDLVPRRVRTYALTSVNPAVPRPQVMALRFSPSGRYLAVGGQDTCVRLLEADTLAERGSTAHATPGCIAFDPAETQVLIGAMFTPHVVWASIGKDGLGEPRSVLLDHRDRITAVDFHPGGDLFLTASNDGTVLIYRTGDRSKFAALPEHGDAVTAATFSQDGTSIVTASLDGSVHVWPVDPVALAERRLPRALTADERSRLARDLAGN